MTHSYILTGIFSFIFLSSLLAVDQRANVVERLALENLRHANVAHAMRLENEGAVLGSTTGSADNGVIEQLARQKTSVLKLLQDDHMVVVEYTENGALIRAVDGKGMSEEERLSEKKWDFAINGNEVETSSDRTIVNPGDTITWTYN